MPYRPTPLGCVKMTAAWPVRERRDLNDRHWGHWRWLQCLPQHRYCRAIRLWWNLYRVTPRGVTVHQGKVRLYLEK